MDTKQAAQWICDTCLSFGATVSTAYKVAGLFAEALEQSAERAVSLSEQQMKGR